MSEVLQLPSAWLNGNGGALPGAALGKQESWGRESWGQSARFLIRSSMTCELLFNSESHYNIHTSMHAAVVRVRGQKTISWPEKNADDRDSFAKCTATYAAEAEDAWRKPFMRGQ